MNLLTFIKKIERRIRLHRGRGSGGPSVFPLDGVHGNFIISRLPASRRALCTSSVQAGFNYYRYGSRRGVLCVVVWAAGRREQPGMPPSHFSRFSKQLAYCLGRGLSISLLMAAQAKGRRSPRRAYAQPRYKLGRSCVW